MVEHEKTDDELLKHTHDPGEGIKELKHLDQISALVEKEGIPSDELLQWTADFIPLCRHSPEIACARITLEGQVLATHNFEETKWKQACDIVEHGDRIGSVEVYYPEERPPCDEGPFLQEERCLITGPSSERLSWKPS